MKIKTAIVSVFGTILVGIILFALALGPLMRLIIGEGTTTPEAVRLITQVEGIDRINKDAQHVFELFDTKAPGLFESIPNEASFVTISDLKLKLGQYADVVMDKNEFLGNPLTIRIRFGSHFKLKFLYIFDPRKSVDISPFKYMGPRYTVVTSNMLIRSD